MNNLESHHFFSSVFFGILSQPGGLTQSQVVIKIDKNEIFLGIVQKCDKGSR